MLVHDDLFSRCWTGMRLVAAWSVRPVAVASTRRRGRRRRSVDRFVDGLRSMTASLMLVDARCIIRRRLFAAAAAGFMVSMSAAPDVFSSSVASRQYDSHQVRTEFTTSKLCQLPEIDPVGTRRSPVAGILAAGRPSPCHASLPPLRPSACAFRCKSRLSKLSWQRAKLMQEPARCSSATTNPSGRFYWLFESEFCNVPARPERSPHRLHDSNRFEPGRFRPLTLCKLNARQQGTSRKAALLLHREPPPAPMPPRRRIIRPPASAAAAASAAPPVAAYSLPMQVQLSAKMSSKLSLREPARCRISATTPCG